MSVTIHTADVLDFAAKYEGKPFHAMLCDPPYHLTSITKRFGAANAAPAKHGTNGAYARASAGFMGQTWDGGDVAFQPETWAALGALLYPGAFGMAFASSRGWHRMAVAIEDAGFVIHPSLFCWAFGSGFPKATRVKDGGEAWDGHRYGLQAVKPAVEPIIVFQRPYEGRPVDCITGTGAGALNVDGCRIEGEAIQTTNGGVKDERWRMHGSGDWESHPSGRWPANLLLDEEAARRLDEQTGVLKSGTVAKHAGQIKPGQWRAAEGRTDTHRCGSDYAREGDEGGASRFFFTFQHDALDVADPLNYCAKPDRAERDAGLAAEPDRTRNRVKPTGMERDPKWAPVQAKNIHPTVKPIALTRWLATLLLPPAPYAPRRLFVPFCGSGSEAIGGTLAGWDEVVGVERDATYAELARARAVHHEREHVGPLFYEAAA